MNRLPLLLVCLLISAARTDPALVTKVFDGDTIVVRQESKEFTVRLIGVDTPETGRPGTPVQFYGPEATDFTRRSILGKTVQLAYESPDRLGGAVDKYNRILAYVITQDGRNFNLELVRQGYGRAYTRYPFSHQREFEAAEREARQAGRGIWNRDLRSRWSDPEQRGRVIGNLRSRIYHLPEQPGYDRVEEKNRIYFSSEQDAVRAGFRKARN
jgi:micrococcal nuclease